MSFIIVLQLVTLVCQNTLEKVQRRFYWHGMREDVENTSEDAVHVLKLMTKASCL